MGLKEDRSPTQDGPEGEVDRMLGVIVKMQDAEKLSLEQIQALMEATQEVGFAGKERAEMYRWISGTLVPSCIRQSTWLWGRKGTRLPSSIQTALPFRCRLQQSRRSLAALAAAT